jgi:hypothetical protein
MCDYIQDLFADLKNSAIAIPDETCPKIDKVIRDLNRADDCAKNIMRNCENADQVKYLADWCRTEIGDCLDEMEKIREENSKLRELGRIWYQNCREIVSEATKEIEKLHKQYTQSEE